MFQAAFPMREVFKYAGRGCPDCDEAALFILVPPNASGSVLGYFKIFRLHSMVFDIIHADGLKGAPAHVQQN